MKNTATYRRTVAAAGLAAATVLMVVAMGTDVPFSGEPDEVLAEMDAAGGRAWLSAIAYAVAQFALIPGVLGIAHLLRRRAPILSNLGGTLAVLGALGHIVHAGGVLMIVSMAQGEAERGALATALEEYQASAVGIFSAIGLLGTVLGLVLLTIGLWRAEVGPRWVPAALAAFLVVEFGLYALSPWAATAAAVLYVASFGALALTIWRSPVESWEVAASPGEVTPERV